MGFNSGFKGLINLTLSARRNYQRKMAYVLRRKRVKA